MQSGDGDEALTPRDGERGRRRQRGDAREQHQRGDRESGSVGSAAQADGVAATHDDGGQSTTQNTPCSLHADANLQAGGGRRSASRELAGLSTSRCDTAPPATQVRRGGSRAARPDRPGGGPAAAGGEGDRAGAAWRRAGPGGGGSRGGGEGTGRDGGEAAVGAGEPGQDRAGGGGGGGAETWHCGGHVRDRNDGTERWRRAHDERTAGTTRRRMTVRHRRDRHCRAGGPAWTHHPHPPIIHPPHTSPWESRPALDRASR